MPLWLGCPFLESLFSGSTSQRQKTLPCLTFANPKLRDERVDTSSFQVKAPVFLPEIKVDGEQQTVVFKVRTPQQDSFPVFVLWSLAFYAASVLEMSNMLMTWSLYLMATLIEATSLR